MGLVTAKALAADGAEIIIVGRSLEKSQRVVEDIKKETGNEKITYLLADLSSQEAIRNLVREFHKKYDKLHLLVNNAGGFFVKKEMSVDGIEMTFALNHLSYFFLTNLLLDTLKQSAPSRIVSVSSWEHFRVKYEPDDLQCEKGYYCLEAYAKSKLCNVLFTYELARRLVGSGVTANVLHPGWVATNIGKNNGILAKIALPVMHLKAIPVEEGAKTCIHLCKADELTGVSGKYFNKLKIDKSCDDTYNEEYAKDLWAVSEKLCGLAKD